MHYSSEEEKAMNEYVDNTLDKIESVKRMSEKRRMSRIQNLNFLQHQNTNMFYDDKRQSMLYNNQGRPTTVLNAPLNNEDLLM